MKYLLDLDMDKCISCGACAVACMDQHDTNLEHGDPALRWVTRLERQQGERVAFLGLSMACMHCNDAPCVTGCPVGCLHKDPETGMTVVNPTHCIGCHSCAMACPFGAPKFDPQGKIVKCDGCADRVRGGLGEHGKDRGGGAEAAESSTSAAARAQINRRCLTSFQFMAYTI